MTDAQNQIIGLLKEIKAATGGGGGAAWGGITGTLSAQADLQAALDALEPPYKVYTALLTQTGSNDPVAVVLQNTTGATFTWARAGAGIYTISTAADPPPLTADKTCIMPGLMLAGVSGDKPSMSLLAFTGGNTITIETRVSNGGGTLADDVLVSTFFEIRVYNP